MQIISHRGAKGLATENTIDAITAAAVQDVTYIEFDVHFTKNNKLVVYHDGKTPSGKRIADMTYKALRREVPFVPQLHEALAACKTKPALIEPKAKGTVARCLKELKKFPNAAVASFHADEVLAARINAPSHTTFLLQHYHPFGIIKKAKFVDAHGIGLNKNWFLLFPYYYHVAKKEELLIYTYTVNSRWFAEWLHTFFPHLMICSDHPDKLLAVQLKSAHE